MDAEDILKTILSNMDDTERQLAVLRAWRDTEVGEYKTRMIKLLTETAKAVLER